ncbi:hypothetical protein RF55_9118 [Lasius niger]|uniref:Uncharacterized protein n=1 Tax=Lasius niger TaxID=67767 RepID=A0A0J7KLA0_LASNI|nr:hypothetical protein RF55_9118 [Lasius niger]
MGMSTENESNLLSQGDFGTLRDRHSGEPDAAGSSSCKGTVDVVSASASAVAKATTELIEEVDTLETVPISRGGKSVKEKRKASSSPGNEVEEAVAVGARRHNKFRILDPKEVEQEKDVNSDLESQMIYEEATNYEKLPGATGSDKSLESSPEYKTPIRRSSRKTGGSSTKAVFGGLRESLEGKKGKRIVTTMDDSDNQLEEAEEKRSDRSTSSKRLEDLVRPIVEWAEEESAREKKSKGSPFRKSSLPMQTIEISSEESNSEGYSSTRSSRKAKKRKKKGGKEGEEDRKDPC